MRGLCGNYNGQKEDELLMPNGSQAKNVTQFGNSWKVDNPEDSRCVFPSLLSLLPSFSSISVATDSKSAHNTVVTQL